MNEKARREFWILVISQVTIYSSFFTFLQFPVFIQSVGGDERTIGWIMGLGSIAATLSMPLQGPLFERLPLKPVMLTGVLLTALTTLACLTLTAPGVLMASLLIGRSLGFVLFQNATGVAIARIIPKGERARRLGFVFAGNTIATALGPALGEGIINTLGFPALFLTSMGLQLVGGAMLFPVSPIRALRSMEGFSIPAAYRQFFRELFHPSLRYLFLTLLMMACVVGGIFNFTAVYARSLALPSGLFFIGFSVVNALSRMGGGGLSDRFGRSTVVLPFMVLFAGGVVTYSFTGSLPMLIFSSMLMGLGFSLINPTISAQMLDQTPTEVHSVAMVSFHFAYNLGMMLSAPVLGALAKGFGFPAMWQILGGVVGLGIAFYFLGIRAGRKPPSASDGRV